MTTVTTVGTDFEMRAIREVLRHVSATPAIEQQIDALEKSVRSNPLFVCDLSKALIESTCKIILEDRGITPDSKWDAQKLLKETLILLPLVGGEASAVTKAREAIAKMIRGQLQTIQGFCEIRNIFGLTSHGKGGELPRLGDHQVLYAAQAADAVVAFLYRIHRTSLEFVPAQQLYYEDYEAFNQSLDELYGDIEIGSCVVKTSRVFYHFDIIAYRDALEEYLGEPVEDDDGSDDEASAVTESKGEEAEP